MSNIIYDLIKRPFTFLFKWRSFSRFRIFQYIFMFSSMPMLAFGLKPYDQSMLLTIIFTILALYSGLFAALIWNDITDADIDTIAHPNRAIPAGRITTYKFFHIALVFSGMTFFFSYLVSFWCFILSGCAALFVAFHNKYLKKMVKLPAYSEIFTPFQWTVVPVFGFLAISGSNFQNLLIIFLFTYFADAAHDLPLGIYDAEADRKYGVKTFTTSFGEKNAAKISFIMVVLSGIIGIILYLQTILSYIFLISFLILLFYILFHSYAFMKMDENQMKKFGKIFGLKTFRLLWITYDLIFLDLFVQIILLNM